MVALPPAPNLKEEIRLKAAEIGFDRVGFAPAGHYPERASALKAFIEAGYHGEMGWMAETYERRHSPSGLWPEAKSVITLAMNYGPDHNPLQDLDKKDRGVISVYAQNKDYHDLIKKRLKQLARWLVERYGPEVKVFVDTAPVMEKPIAQESGLGWQGKHSNLVSRDFGSWLFLGEVFTTLEIAPDAPEVDHCGSCSACLDICPTKAFPQAYRLDARRCISYLTIEHKGPIPLEFRQAIGNRIYGCDDCLAICPWNKFAQKSQQEAFHPREGLRAPLLVELSRLDDAAFRALFRASPIKRIGRDRFLRNVMIALGNSAGSHAIDAVMARLNDSSPLVRAMAVWALGQLDSETFSNAKATQLPLESDQAVIAEWMRRA